jgi:hypothetical protein
MSFTTPDALANLVAPWARFYSHSKLAATVVTFLHIAPIVVGGGIAIALRRCGCVTRSPARARVTSRSCAPSILSSWLR